MKNPNTVALKIDVWTIRTEDEIILSTSVAKDVRLKIAELTKSQKTTFTLTNNIEEWSRKFRIHENKSVIEHMKYIRLPIII